MDFEEIQHIIASYKMNGRVLVIQFLKKQKLCTTKNQNELKHMISLYDVTMLSNE